MTGPQLHIWRQSHGLTLRQLAERLGSESNTISHTTISRWEASPSEIPDWATSKLLGTTELSLPLNELHQLLDIARLDGESFKEVLQKAIKAYLRDRRPPGTKTEPVTLPAQSAPLTTPKRQIPGTTERQVHTSAGTVKLIEPDPAAPPAETSNIHQLPISHWQMTEEEMRAKGLKVAEESPETSAQDAQ